MYIWTFGRAFALHADVWGLSPYHDRLNLLKRVVTVPLPNAKQVWEVHIRYLPGRVLAYQVHPSFYKVTFMKKSIVIPVSLSCFSLLSGLSSEGVGLNEHLWSSIRRLWNLLNKSKKESSLISSWDNCWRTNEQYK